MKKEVAKKIVRGITDKIECNTVDIDDWAEFWGFTREEYEDFLDMAIKALDQQPCEDCVSREAVEKITWEEPSYTDALNVLTEVREKIRQLPSVTPKARWIPCSERLPERDENVLTYHRNESFDYQYVSWIDDYSGKWAGFIGNLSDEVLAWMPLPEGYKEEDE